MKSNTPQIAIDCGSYRTAICNREGEVLLNERSLAYYNPYWSGKVHSFGTIADFIKGKGYSISPLIDFKSNNVVYAARMISSFANSAFQINKPHGLFRRIGVYDRDVVVALPLSSEADLMRGISASIKANNLYFVKQPVVAALGAGLDAMGLGFSMIVDIGHKTTDIAIISNGEISYSSSIPYAGLQLNNDIEKYLLEKYGFYFGGKVEMIKHSVGVAIIDLPAEVIPDIVNFRGINAERTKRTEQMVSPEDVCNAIDATLSKIEDEIKSVLAQVPPQVYKYIKQHGISLVGGTSRLLGIEQRFTRNIGIECRVAEDLDTVVASGAAKAFDNNLIYRDYSLY